MSFSRHNENFLKFEFNIPLRGLSIGERVLKYDRQIKHEARRRFQLYYETVKNDLPYKIAFYQELLELFGGLEKHFILYSIYLDPSCDAVIADLGPIVIQQLDMVNEPLLALFERMVTVHDGSSTKGFLKQYFSNVLDLSTGEWEEEDGKRNPVTNKLTAWLIGSLTKENTNVQELEQCILNYTKLWNVYFTHPYNLTKALILLHKLFESYRHLDPQEIKINLYGSLSNLNRFIGELLPAPYHSPLTDIHQPSIIFKDQTVLGQPSFQPYLNKNHELHERLAKDAVFFKDLSDLIWSELFTEACLIPIPARMAYLNEIKKRYASDRAPKFKDINEFLSMIRTTDKNIDRKALDSIIAANYIFYF